VQPESPVVSQWSRGSNQPDLRRIACNPNYWYPLAWGRQLKRNKTLSVAFAGDPIVLVRTDSNRVFALEDRCAHRQFPLSKGTVCGEQIQCGYHAWRYDASGALRSIPYLVKGGDEPCRAVRAYPCREAYGLIFVFPGDPALAEQPRRRVRRSAGRDRHPTPVGAATVTSHRPEHAALAVVARDDRGARHAHDRRVLAAIRAHRDELVPLQAVHASVAAGGRGRAKPGLSAPRALRTELGCRIGHVTAQVNGPLGWLNPTSGQPA